MTTTTTTDKNNWHQRESIIGTAGNSCCKSSQDNNNSSSSSNSSSDNNDSGNKSSSAGADQLDDAGLIDAVKAANNQQDSNDAKVTHDAGCDAGCDARCDAQCDADCAADCDDASNSKHHRRNTDADHHHDAGIHLDNSDAASATIVGRQTGQQQQEQAATDERQVITDDTDSTDYYIESPSSSSEDHHLNSTTTTTTIANEATSVVHLHTRASSGTTAAGLNRQQRLNSQSRSSQPTLDKIKDRLHDNDNSADHDAGSMNDAMASSLNKSAVGIRSEAPFDHDASTGADRRLHTPIEKLDQQRRCESPTISLTFALTPTIKFIKPALVNGGTSSSSSSAAAASSSSFSFSSSSTDLPLLSSGQQLASLQHDQAKQQQQQQQSACSLVLKDKKRVTFDLSSSSSSSSSASSSSISSATSSSDDSECSDNDNDDDIDHDDVIRDQEDHQLDNCEQLFSVSRTYTLSNEASLDNIDVIVDLDGHTTIDEASTTQSAIVACKLTDEAEAEATTCGGLESPDCNEQQQQQQQQQHKIIQNNGSESANCCFNLQKNCSKETAINVKHDHDDSGANERSTLSETKTNIEVVSIEQVKQDDDDDDDDDDHEAQLTAAIALDLSEQTKQILASLELTGPYSGLAQLTTKTTKQQQQQHNQQKLSEEILPTSQLSSYNNEFDRVALMVNGEHNKQAKLSVDKIDEHDDVSWASNPAEAEKQQNDEEKIEGTGGGEDEEAEVDNNNVHNNNTNNSKLMLVDEKEARLMVESWEKQRHIESFYQLKNRLNRQQSVIDMLKEQLKSRPQSPPQVIVMTPVGESTAASEDRIEESTHVTSSSAPSSSVLLDLPRQPSQTGVDHNDSKELNWISQEQPLADDAGKDVQQMVVVETHNAEQCSDRMFQLRQRLSLAESNMKLLTKQLRDSYSNYDCLEISYNMLKQGVKCSDEQHTNELNQMKLKVDDLTNKLLISGRQLLKTRNRLTRCEIKNKSYKRHHSNCVRLLNFSKDLQKKLVDLEQKVNDIHQLIMVSTTNTSGHSNLVLYLKSQESEHQQQQQQQQQQTTSTRDKHQLDDHDGQRLESDCEESFSV